MMFTIKKIIAFLLNLFGITNLCIKQERKKYGFNYIRIINFHNTEKRYLGNFQDQIIWLKKHYHNVSYEEFKTFMNLGVLENVNCPGVMLTFDDGLYDNYYGAELLNKNGMTGYFMVSSDLVGTKGYMTKEQLRKLVSHNHIIGCHTATHHRMNDDDTTEKLNYEIAEAKRKLEDIIEEPVEIFCWCGGEESTYTCNAERIIEQSGYKYGFMTNSYPLIPETKQFHIQRINVEASWPVYLMKFQISGLMDKKLQKKRERVDKLTTLN